MSKSTVIVLEDNFASARGSITGQILMSAAVVGGFVIEGAARVNASQGRPGLMVQSGDLIGSIETTRAKVSKTYAEVDVGPTMIYGRIHEYGGVIKTSRAIIVIPARPYLRPAVDNNEDNIRNAVEEEVWRNLLGAT